VGIAYGTFGALSFVVGSVLGGYFAAKLNLRRALIPLCAVFNLPYIAYVFLAWFQPSSVVVITSAIVVEWFGYGFGFIAVTLFMMQQMATGRYKMSHYAIATSAMQVGLILPGMWSGKISDAIGYRNFFIWVMASTVFSFAMAWLVPFKKDEDIAAEDLSRGPTFKWLYFDFNGRLRRGTYWFAQLTVLVFLGLLAGGGSIVAGLWTAIGASAGEHPAAAWTVKIMGPLLVGVLGALALISLVALVSISVKRCHDRGRSGWFTLLGLVPVVGIWYLVEVWFLRGTVGPNRFGDDTVDWHAPQASPAMAAGA